MMNERILLVDDDEDVILMFAQALKNEGYQVVSAYNGKEALEKVRQAYEQGLPFNLYLSDVRMPILDGPSFVEQVRGEGIDGTTKIIFMTGGCSDEQKRKIQHICPEKTLAKPFELGALITAINDTLKG